MSHAYEWVAVLWMASAITVALMSDPSDATYAAGLSIASGTLALVHEHRRARGDR